MASQEDNGEADKWVPSKKPEASKERFSFNKLKELAKRRNVQIGLIIFVIVIIIIIIVAVVAGGGQNVPSISQDNTTQRIDILGGHKIIYRDQWNGTVPKSSEKLKTPVSLVEVEQVGQTICYTQEACSKIVRNIQTNSIAENAPDIYNNFVLGTDGNIYVGRGWDVKPQGENRINLAIIGNFNFDQVSNKTEDAAQQLLKYGVDRSLLTDNYKLVCHNQTVQNGNCGSNLYSKIKEWKHFDPGQYFDQ